MTTKHYVVTIIDDREEGDVTSDSIVYLGVSKRTGKSIRLVGSTWHNTDPTGAPGQMYGYIFKNGDTYYCVYLSGTLEIRRKNWDIVVSEDGKMEQRRFMLPEFDRQYGGLVHGRPRMAGDA